jgi:hypothetical protein
MVARDPARPAEPAARAGAGAVLGALRAARLVLERLSRALAWLCVGGWSLLIYALSSQPIDIGPEDSFPLKVLGNAVHAPLFGLWALWLAAALGRRPRSVPPRAVSRRVVLLATLAFGALDEVHQAFVPGRSPSPLDLVTDVVGAACVLHVAAYVGRADASERGLLARLAACLAACLAAALAASLGP